MASLTDPPTKRPAGWEPDGPPLKHVKPTIFTSTDGLRQARQVRDLLLELADLHFRRCDRIEDQQRRDPFRDHPELREAEEMSIALLELLHAMRPAIVKEAA